MEKYLVFKATEMPVEIHVSSTTYRSKGRKVNKFYPLKTASTSKFCVLIFSGEKMWKEGHHHLICSLSISNVTKMPQFLSST